MVSESQQPTTVRHGDPLFAEHTRTCDIVHPPRLERTIHECIGCGRIPTAGWNDGSVAEPGWHDVDHIDGPNALCPECSANPEESLGDLREEYPNVSVGAKRPWRHLVTDG
jgi:hypothetical protein